MVDEDKQEQPGPAQRKRSRLKEGLRHHTRTETALEKERNFFAAVLESAAAFILVLDCDGRILHANRTTEAATGYSADDLYGQKFSSVLPIREAGPAFNEGLRQLAGGAVAYPFERYWVTSTGERLLVAGSLTPLHDASGTLSHIVITASDVTEHRALEDKLRVLSLRDALTGLYNRRGFSLLAEQQLKESRRSRSTLTIVYADVDHLKFINDAFGHSAGDNTLGLCARALQATFRESDVVARIGGDEFVVLAQADARELETLAMLLEQEIDRRSVASDLRFSVALTIGTAYSRPPHALSLDELLRRADEFMYERKHNATPQSA